MGQDNTVPELKVVADRRPATEPKFFRIRDFEKLQHYKNRNPSWVKLYGEQIEDYEFQQLPDHVKFHALALTVLASKTGNKIPNDPQWVAGRIGAQEPVNLTLLYQIGYLEGWLPRPQDSYEGGEQLALPESPDRGKTGGETGASKVLASCYQSASTDTETERETETHTETDTAPASAGRMCICCGRCVFSEFSFQDALNLAESWKVEGRLIRGEPIRNPGGLARLLHQEGTADAEIRLLLRPPPRREFTDEPCPTCLGTKYETAPGKGARPCAGCLDEKGVRTGKRAFDYKPP